jgi:hypothetical protein
MTTKNRSFRPSPAMIIACLALLLALTGSAVAAGIAKNSVRSAQIADGTVRTVDLRDNAVNSAKVADDSLAATDLAPDSVGNSEIAENAVASPEVAPDSLTAGDLGPNSVGGSEIAPDSVRATQLGTITQRNISATIQAGKTGSVSANCEPGEQIISGGGQPSVFGVEMTSSRPSGNGWLYQAKNNSAADQTITAFALCLVQYPRLKSTTQPAGTTSPGRFRATRETRRAP